MPNAPSLTLTEIWIYPIKSLGGIRLQTAKVQEKGLQYDRRFMLIEENGLFMTQRVYPQMALFKTSITGSELAITHKGDTLPVPLTPQAFQLPRPVQIWDDLVMANEVDPAYSAWFSQRLGIKCHLVYFPEENPRAVDPKYKVNDEHVGLADAYPFLIIGQASLNDLNTRLENPLPMNRFRPNLVFTGGQPYEEESWRNFTIGTNRFVGVKPCARCVLTTVNQETAEKGKEPLKTLATYRNINNKILFGQNVVALDHQTITVGDTVTLQ
jgi:uncharacterized protein